MLEELEVSTGDRIHSYVWGTQNIDDIVMRIGDAANSEEYYVLGANNNVISRLDYQGDVFERYVYGMPTALTEDWAGYILTEDLFLFTGRQLHVDHAQYDFRARWQDPEFGVFITRDPIGIWGDPLSFGNGYAFLGGDPVNRVDPWGLKIEVKKEDCGNKAFRQNIEIALKAICPCFRYTADEKDCVVTMERDEEDQDKFCRCYCRDILACNVVADIVGDVFDVTIESASTTYTEGGRHIFYESTSDAHNVLRSRRGGGLFHEFVHVVRGNKNPGKRGSPEWYENEKQTTFDTNQVPRFERTTYDRRDINFQYGKKIKRVVSEPIRSRMSARPAYQCYCD